MKNKLLSMLAASVFFIVTAYPSFSSENNNPVGKWKFNATGSPDPYYSTGTMEISNADNRYSVAIIFPGSNYKLIGEKSKFENNILTFSVYVEGEEVVLTCKMNGPDKMDGKAVYSQGEVKVALVKEPAGK